MKGSFDLRGLVGIPAKAFQNLVKIEKFAPICEAWMGFLQKPFGNGSKFKRFLRFSWSSRISYKNHWKPGQNWKSCFDLRCLAGRISEKKPFKNGSKLKSLLRFPKPTWISCENHSKTSQFLKCCFDLRGVLGFPTKTIQNLFKIKRLLRFAWSIRISYKNHSKSGQSWKAASICVA